MDLARSLRVAMAQKNIKGPELSRLSGIDPSYISLIRNEKRECSMEYLKRLSRAFEMKVSEFIALGEDQ